MIINFNYSVALIIFLLLLSAVFSLVKVVFLRIHSRKEIRDITVREKRINDFVDSNGFNETISIGRIFCNMTIAVLGYIVTEPLIKSFSYPILAFILYLLAVGLVVYFITVFSPNLFGHLKPGMLSIILEPIYKWIRLPILGLSRLVHFIYNKLLQWFGYDAKFNFLSEDQRDAIQSDMTTSKNEGSLEDDERQMILNIFDFVETPVREIMTPRVDMCAIDVKSSLEKTIETLNNERHSRLPVYKDSIDNIIGILSNRDFLEWYTEHGSEPFNIESIVMPAFFVPYYKKIDDLLTELRRNGNQLAVVVDEYGGTAGLVTVEDILEEIVGEIKDEDDEDEGVQKLKDGRYILDPLMTLSDLEYELKIKLKEPENSHIETLSGLIQATLGTIPSPGAEVEIDGYKIRVLAMDGTRMEKVLIITPNSSCK